MNSPGEDKLGKIHISGFKILAREFSGIQKEDQMKAL